MKGVITAMITAAVFDVGRTLMEYVDMPNSWKDYYPAAIRNVRDSLGLDVNDKELDRALEIFTSYSPRVNYREVDYTPEHIFADVISEWRCKPELSKVISAFFDSMKLKARIYPETVSLLKNLHRHRVKIGVLTDVATGMPDELHKSYFSELLPYFDCYVSSVSCGYRKPNPHGLGIIAHELEVTSDEMIMIGDEPKDIEVAKRFGCKSVLIDRNSDGNHPDYGQDYTICNLDQLRYVFIKANVDFNRLTPCGGDCRHCPCYKTGECSGCLVTGGIFVSYWQNCCRICPCCKEHNVKFCGLCPEFPCDWLSDNLAKWDKDGIFRMGELAREYRLRQCQMQKFSDSKPDRRVSGEGSIPKSENRPG